MEYESIIKRERINIIPVTKPGLNIKEVCDGLLNNKIYISKRYPTLSVEGDLWRADPLKDRSWRFWLHTLTIIESLIYGYELYGDIQYINKAILFLEDWHSKNPPDSTAVSEMSWHDHSTALRLIIICKLYESFRMSLFSKEKHLFFEKIIDEHCQKLMNDSFYMPNHNHGLDQDIALYTASITFSYMKKANEWREISLKRFWKQVDHLIAEDGSYKEHSPAYVYIFLGRFYTFYQFINKYDPAAANKLIEYLDKLLTFFIYIVQPDGQIPPIGDSEMSPFILWTDLPEPLMNKAKLLKKPHSLLNEFSLEKVFSEGGYAFLRNQWNYTKETVQAILYSSFHSRVHKHKDDLALILYGNGVPILTDAGKFSYNYSDPGRIYAESARAHNTIVVAGEEMDTSKANIGKSGLNGYFFCDNLSVVSGTHCLYRGVLHYRLLIFLKPSNFLLIDWGIAKDTKTVVQNFLFHPSIDCSSDGKTVIGKFRGKECISLIPLIHNHGATQLKKGRISPLEGWYSPKHSILEPTWNAQFTQTGKEARFATQMLIDKSKPAIDNFSWYGNLVKFKTNQQEVMIILHQYTHELYLNGTKMNWLSLPNTLLENEVKKRWKELKG
ncbi:heparinase II/III family protein [Neobacillus sp. SCS-31]|uniref:heparinase II/III family protein n=1 Tax=Neobacillus oceani TaxID=3115292 RepID=UPI0039059D57